jgi:N-methylhydantoinase A
MPPAPDDPTVRISADIGGTFTDLIALERRTGAVSTLKLASSPDQPAQSVLDGVRRLLAQPGELDSLVHGQTVALNAFLEGKGARVLLLMTAGVRDAYTIARHDRRDLYAIQYRKPARLVPRRDVLEITERLRADGSVEIPLDLASLEPTIELVHRDGIPAVAVCLLHAYINPMHEHRIRDALQERCPGVFISLSSDVAREWREYERASTAVLNAHVAPNVERYLAYLERELAGLSVTAPVRIMQSNGGVTSTRSARRQPIQTLLSGPVGGAIAAARLGQTTGRPNVICADMGGTSFDVSLVVGGRPSGSTETELRGLPLLLPLVDIHTIGAGGGSIAWLEAGGLRVGPRSAGASPGPACYGRGGAEPTVTDANLLLGRLDAECFLGGRMALDAGAALAAAVPIASELGLDELELADGILTIVNAAMADAIRTITVKQGIDPRDFSLVAFGGAGPMHAVALAEELGIHEVLVPWSPGTFSAWGMLQTDIRQDFTRSYIRTVDGLTGAELLAALRALEREGAAALEADGVDAGRLAFLRSADLRYVGQEYTVNVALPEGAEIEPEHVAERFHEAHRGRYAHSMPDAQVEFVNLRIGVLGQIDQWSYDLQASPAPSDTEPAARRVVFDGAEHETRMVHRAAIGRDEFLRGPLLIQEDSATTVIPPNWEVRSDSQLNLIVSRR